jgi:acyl-CoA thioesterase-2
VRVSTPVTDFNALLRLEAHGPDTWVGVSADYAWGRIYGGQVVAQGLWAALCTVETSFVPHSLHAYFIRAGEPSEPVRFEVDRLRDGRSFCTRAVVARQSGGAILHLSCSFHKREEAAEVQTARMPLAPDPDDFAPFREDWPWLLSRRPVPNRPGSGQSLGWVRVIDEIDDSADDRIQYCGLALTSDTLQFDSVRSIHPLQVPPEKYVEAFMGASLDHAVWFHRPVQADAWHLYNWVCHGLTGARGMTVGNVFSLDGTHVATVAQEVLLRERRPR